MSNSELKAKILTLLQEVEDPELLNAILASLRHQETLHKDWWDDLPPAAKSSIERGHQDVLTGRTKSHDEVWEKYKHSG